MTNSAATSIDYDKEAQKIEKNYKDLVKIRKTGVRDDIRTIVERIEEHKRVQKDALENVERQCEKLQNQHSEMIEMEKQIPIFRKKIQEAERKLMSKDKILSILLSHTSFYIKRGEAGYIITIGNTKQTVFQVYQTQNGVMYIPTIGFPKDFPDYLLEQDEISYSKLREYCDEIENLLNN